MLPGLTKKEMIFQEYANNLKLLFDHKLIGTTAPCFPFYLCPICLMHYSSIDEKSNPLTLEHVPPESLGGKATVLTCAKCNNEAGYKIDAHLVERLRQMDKEKLAPGEEMKVTVSIDGAVFRGMIFVEDDGTLRMHHSKMNNHPEKLDQAMKNLKGGTKLEADFWRKKVIPENLEYALLKSGYLKVFEKLGYSVILNSCFDDVREQITNPEKRIYPEGFWLTPPDGKISEGVYFVTSHGYECLLAVFNLNTGKSERLFATILPTPIRPVSDVIEELHAVFEEKDSIELNLYPTGGADKEYLNSIEDIKEMKSWFEKRKALAKS